MSSPPNVFYRGSTMLTTTLSQVEWVGGPVRVSPGFHFDRLSVASPVEPPLKARGNDGVRIATIWQLPGIDPMRLKKPSRHNLFHALNSPAIRITFFLASCVPMGSSMGRLRPASTKDSN
jgi:hypothetical protein